MTIRRRDDRSDAPASGDASPDDLLLTSDDIFGDLLDGAPAKGAPPAPPPRKAAARFPPPPGRKGPIKVQVSEPGAVRKGPEAGPPDPEPLPEDVAALLDAFSEPAEAAVRAEPRPQPEP